MAESIFNRPMFQNINNEGPDFSKPIVPKFGNTEDPNPSTAVGGKEVPRLDFGNPKYQQPLGMDEIYAKAAAEIDPAKIKSMYTEYAGEPKSFQDFAFLPALFLFFFFFCGITIDLRA